MAYTQIIVSNAGLQPFETASEHFDPSDLLGIWQEKERIELHEEALSMPYEVAYARALQLPSDEGCIAWAAFESGTTGQPCAWFHPCHLDVGMTDMVMQPVDMLHLSPTDSRELHAVIAPLMVQDGITLRYHSPQRWLATGGAFADMECASLARVQGRSINEWLPDAGEFPQQTKLARLQAEVQMMLYTHPINDARAARNLPSVNSFWIDGAGSLATIPTPNGVVKLESRLQDAAGHANLYANAWGSLVGEWRQQAAALAQGDELGITLCGNQNAITCLIQAPHWKHTFLRLLGRKPATALRGML